ncbi:two-component system OmpR family sensor kinase [Nakamurella sp. UYEF19]
MTIPGYGSFRVSARAGNSDGTVFVTGASLSEVTDTQKRLAVIMALVAGGAIVLGGLIVFVIVRRSVRPLERVAATARKVATLPLDRGEVDLAIRVPTRDTDARTEIGSVGAAINQMLGHVSGALTARHASETRVRQFVADASHELRTPLAAIRGYAELARRGEHEPGAVAHALRRVESESARMTTLVDDLLLLARLDSGRPLATEEVDLTMLVVDRVSDARVAGTDHRWQLDLPDEPVTVTGDGARLHQVLANLLANARNHTPPGTVVVTGVRREPGGAVMTVTDNGPGIPTDLQPEIFGRFVRGDSSRSRAAGSTGLGLAIVAAVISAHGGTVTVESRPGRTCARVWLPDHVEFRSPAVDPLPNSSGTASLTKG